MACLEARSTISMTVTFTVPEDEARALDALVGYGDDGFIKAFYEKLGEAYMRKHEQALRRFFKSVRSFLPGLLEKANTARKAFDAEHRTAQDD